MLTFLRQLKAQGLRFAGWCLLPFSLFIFTLHFLFFHLARLRRAEVIILPEILNFAGTTWVPDYARHRFPHKRILFLIFHEPFHNPSLPLIWEENPDVDGLVLRRIAIDFTFRDKRLILPRRRLFDPFARKILMFLAKFGGRRPVFLDYRNIMGGVEISEEYKDRFEEALRQEKDKERAERNRLMMNNGMYFHLQRTIPLPSPSLPERYVTEITKALNDVCSRRPRKGTCGFYLKENEGGAPDLYAGRKAGSSFDDYLPSFRLLTERGYQILLTGDRPLPVELSEEFGGMIVDARTQPLGIPIDLFRLYAALHTDIFMGDSGGGANLATLRKDRYILVLNAPQFSIGLNCLWLYYKHTYTPEGRHLSYAEMAGKYQSSLSVPGDFLVESNTADEILEATQCYLDEAENPGTSQIDKSLEDMWPFHSIFKMGACHISPAFVRNYHKKVALDPASQPMQKAVPEGVITEEGSP